MQRRKVSATMKKLPIGIQTFSAIREDDYVYIEKRRWCIKWSIVPDGFFSRAPDALVKAC